MQPPDDPTSHMVFQARVATAREAQRPRWSMQKFVQKRTPIITRPANGQQERFCTLPVLSSNLQGDKGRPAS